MIVLRLRKGYLCSIFPMPARACHSNTEMWRNWVIIGSVPPRLQAHNFSPTLLEKVNNPAISEENVIWKNAEFGWNKIQLGSYCSRDCNTCSSVLTYSEILTRGIFIFHALCCLGARVQTSICRCLWFFIFASLLLLSLGMKLEKKKDSWRAAVQ